MKTLQFHNARVDQSTNTIIYEYLDIRTHHETRKKKPPDELTTRAENSKLILYRNQQLCKNYYRIGILLGGGGGDMMLFKTRCYKTVLSFVYDQRHISFISITDWTIYTIKTASDPPYLVT